MAVCALAAVSSGRITLAERYQVDTLLATLDRLSIYDPHEAIDILDTFIFRLREDPDSATELQAKIHRYADHEEAAHTLLRIAYLVISADEGIAPGERAMFDELCVVLGADPGGLIAGLAGDAG